MTGSTDRQACATEDRADPAGRPYGSGLINRTNRLGSLHWKLKSWASLSVMVSHQLIIPRRAHLDDAVHDVPLRGPAGSRRERPEIGSSPSLPA